MSYRRCFQCGGAWFPRRAAHKFCPECFAAQRPKLGLVDAFERQCDSLPSAGVTTGDERAQERVELFDAIGPDFQLRFWGALGDEVERAREQLRLDSDDVPVRRPKVGRRWAEQGPGPGIVRRRTKGNPGFTLLPGVDTDDPLHEVSPLDYVPMLTGTPVPPNGKINCPLHDDRTPSLKVYADHWHCFGCGAGGDVYALAAALWGRELRGDDFKTVRRELARLILSEAA